MKLFTTLLALLLALHSVAFPPRYLMAQLPNPPAPPPPPPLQHPHLPGHPLIPDPTKKSDPSTTTDTERLESLRAYNYFEIMDTIGRIQRTLAEMTSARRARRQEIENALAHYLARQNDLHPRHDGEVEENDWDGNFTIPAGPRPPPKSAPF